MFIQLIRRLIPNSLFLWFQHESDATKYKFRGLGEYSISTNALVKRVTADADEPKGLTEAEVSASLLLGTPGGFKATKRDVKKPSNVRDYRVKKA